MVSFMSCPFVYKYFLLLNPHIIGFISLVFFITLPVYETFMIFILSLLLKEKYKIYERRKQKCQRRKDAKKKIIINVTILQQKIVLKEIAVMSFLMFALKG